MKEILQSLKDQHITKLKKAVVNNKGKTPVTSYLLKYGYDIPFSAKKDIKVITELFTGHNFLAYSRNNRDKQILPHCKHCYG